MNKRIALFAICFSFAVVGCSSQKSVEYPRAVDAQEKANSVYEDNKEWAKEKANKAVETAIDYAAVGTVKAGEAYDVAVEKAEEWAERLKKRAEEYRRNHK